MIKIIPLDAEFWNLKLYLGLLLQIATKFREIVQSIINKVQITTQRRIVKQKKKNRPIGDKTLAHYDHG